MSDPIVSVVIPTYNSADFIRNTLSQLRAQIFKEFEVVVVNDGSSDNTQDEISKFIDSNKDLNIKLFYQKNKGIAGARNRGILEAQGRYIAFLDHDDIWYPLKLKKCMEVFQKHPEIDLVCHSELMREQSGKIIKTLPHGPNVAEMSRSLLFKGNCLSTSATVVKKAVLSKVGLFKEGPEFSTVEDYDLWIRLSKAHKFYFINDILGEYIINGRNASCNLEIHYCNQARVIKENFKERDKKIFFDQPRINLRVSKNYLLLCKEGVIHGNVKNVIKYLFKGLFATFGHG